MQQSRWAGQSPRQFSACCLHTAAGREPVRALQEQSQFLTAPCPKVLKSELYGEKADIWAAGCILYQMATLSPPFYSTNMLSLATKIVEAVYEPVPEGIYSEKVTTTISRCLRLDAEARPDIVEVSSMIADVMMKYFDSLSTSQLALEKKLERERRRTQRYFMEANRNAVTCQREPALLSHGVGLTLMADVSEVDRVKAKTQVAGSGMWKSGNAIPLRDVTQISFPSLLVTDQDLVT
ncbi:serine/threonine-protein kinase Nek10-like [Vicugna pacos]|uniref:Serine/threonine-protein kinase Nek10-like n=1 Tax=Vicugna pacos TaxID=30538 RepID=A0ABM5BKL4_VICPA